MDLQPDEILILNIVRVLQRWGLRVFPKTVMPYYGMTQWEQTVRYKMKKLAQRGYLVREGGDNARRGYRLSDRVQFV